MRHLCFVKLPQPGKAKGSRFCSGVARQSRRCLDGGVLIIFAVSGDETGMCVAVGARQGQGGAWALEPQKRAHSP